MYNLHTPSTVKAHQRDSDLIPQWKKVLFGLFCVLGTKCMYFPHSNYASWLGRAGTVRGLDSFFDIKKSYKVCFYPSRHKALLVQGRRFRKLSIDILRPWYNKYLLPGMLRTP